VNNLIPRFIYEQFQNGCFSGHFNAASLSIDISGFTTLTEELIQHGLEGAEVLANTMQTVFDPLLEAVMGCGGIVTGFAGDAFTALFPTEGHEPAVYEMALLAGHFIQQHFEQQPVQQTPLGTFSFAVRVGLGAGEVEWGILQGSGEEPLHTYYFRGTAVDACAEAEHQAGVGEFILSPEAAGVLGNLVETAPVSESYLQVTGLKQPLPPIPPASRWQSDPEFLLNFFPPGLVYLAARGEFRPVVTTFLQIKGVTTQQDVARLITLVFSLVAQYGGILARFDFGSKGCTLVLFWGTPVSFENNIVRALECLLDLRQNLEDQRAPDSSQPEASALDFRAGVTYHVMYAGRVGGSWQSEHSCYGRGVNLAARLALKAQWGDIYLDQAVQVEAQTAFIVESKGEQLLKGFADPQPAYSLLGRQQVYSVIYEGDLVGRQAEIARLHQFLQPLWANPPRFAGLLTVYGEPGIGKTRLLYELQQQTAAQARWLLCPCDEVLRQSLNPFKQFLKGFFDQTPANGTAANRRAFERAFARTLVEFQGVADPRQAPIIEELRRTKPILAGILDLPVPGDLWEQLDPQLRFRNMLQAFKNLVKGLSLLQPLVLFIDDLQWMDNDSEEMVRSLSRNIDSFPMAIVCTSRYPDGDERPSSILTASQHAETLDLDVMSWNGIRGIAEKVLGATVTERVVDFLLAKTNGNPFFVEQLSLSLKEQGHLAAQPPGYDLSVGVAANIPTSISGVLIARLDRLPLPVKEIVQRAAVLGFQFEVPVLQQMLRDEKRLPRRMQTAVQAAVWLALSEIDYIFKHTLMREAAYNMQLRARLREGHRLAAQAYQRLYQDELGPYYGHLAYHYEHAGQTAQMLDFLERAGEYASEQYANEMALGYYDKLLATILPPAKTLTIKRKKAQVWYQMGRYQDVVSELEKSVAESLTLGDRQVECELKAKLGEVLWRRREKERSLEVSLAARALAEELGDRRLLGFILKNIGVAEHMHGRVAAALEYHEQARRLLAEAGDRDEEAVVLNSIAVICWQDGNLAGSLAANTEARRIQEAIGSRRGLASSLNNIGIIHRAQGDPVTALACYEQALAIATELGAPLIRCNIEDSIANAYASQGKYSLAHHYHEKALATTEELEIPFWRANFLASRMETFWLEGRPAEAVVLSEELLALATRIKQPALVFTAELMGAKCLALREPAEAIARLEGLLAAAGEEAFVDREQKANLHDELWHLYRQKQPETAEIHRREARRLYELLYEQMPVIKYKERLAILSAA
jgi:class 3 adenylate cyclase/tetratricopeptide (TPR) repeat protein